MRLPLKVVMQKRRGLRDGDDEAVVKEQFERRPASVQHAHVSLLDVFDLAVGVVGGQWVAVAGDEGLGLQRDHGLQRPNPAGAGVCC